MRTRTDRYHISNRTNWWLDSGEGLSCCAKSMLMFLALVSNSESGASWYSRATIGKYTGYQDSQVHRGLLEMAEASPGRSQASDMTQNKAAFLYP